MTHYALDLGLVALTVGACACAVWQSARAEAARRRVDRVAAELDEAVRWQARWTQYCLRNGLSVELDQARMRLDAAAHHLGGRDGRHAD